MRYGTRFVYAANAFSPYFARSCASSSICRGTNSATSAMMGINKWTSQSRGTWQARSSDRTEQGAERVWLPPRGWSKV